MENQRNRSFVVFIRAKIRISKQFTTKKEFFYEKIWWDWNNVVFLQWL